VTGGLGSYVNNFLGLNIDWSLKGLLGYLFYPFTLVIGVPLPDAYQISKIIGERAVVTEVVSYQDLARVMKEGVITDPRSPVIAAYALCGFAHIASMAIFVGGAAALAPSRKRDIAAVGFRALVAATLACLMTACIAGAFFAGKSALLG
jgi:CNT family concentrative nucleoside transporter